MPVVIALLNSYGGLADAAMGFVLMNKIQIITGSLDGTSGFLLSLLMCRAMNRSAMNVLFGAFGKVSEEDAAAGRARRRAPCAASRPRRRRCSSRRARNGHHRARLRHGRGPGAARRRRAGQASSRSAAST